MRALSLRPILSRPLKTGRLFSTSTLIETDWLASNLQDSNIKILDATWHQPALQRDGYTEFCAQHISGAQYFDINKCADTGSSLPHMIPTNAQFEAFMDNLGISNDDLVVIYDNNSMTTAPRAWYTFKTLGHANIGVLNGGLVKWLQEGREVTDMISPITKTSGYKASLNTNMVSSFDDVKANIDSKEALVLDARSPGRFDGTAAEPRPGLRGGHIPGSVNVPFNTLVNSDDSTMLNTEQLKEKFQNAQVDLDVGKPLIVSCGSGVTACNVILGLELVGKVDNVSMYDGSWTEWGARDDAPIEK